MGEAMARRTSTPRGAAAGSPLSPWSAGSEKDAERLLKQMRADRDAGLSVDAGRQTLARFLDTWLQANAKPKVRVSTYRRYEQIVRVHLAPAPFGRLRLEQLRPEHVDRLLEAKRQAGLSPRTRQYIRATLRRALNYARRSMYITINAAALSEPPSEEHHEIRPLTPGEAHQLLAALRGDRLEALYVVALSLGLRQGEALGLQWGDVDLDAGTVTVRRSLQKLKGDDGELAYHFLDVKTRRSRRTIALPAPVVATLRAHRERQLEERKRAPFWEMQWGELIFATETGGPLHGATVTRRLQAILKDAGLPRQRFHDLRHAAASLMLAQGVPARVVMETLGHSTIAVTMNIYSHVMPELQRDAADRMGAFLAETAAG